jgi:hypothetical protein
MPEETQGQAELEPGEVAATPTETVETEPQAIDYAALEERARGLGDGFSLANLADKYEDSRRGMNEAQRAKIEIERELEAYKPYLDEMKRNPQFAENQRKAAEQFLGGGQVDNYDSPQVDNEVTKTLDPVYQRLYSVETQLAGEKMDREIDALRGKGFPIDDGAYNQIMQRVIETRNDDVEAHAWKILGPKMLEQASKQATTEVTEKIKSNSTKYVPTPGGGQSSKPYDVKQMSQSDIDDDMVRDIEEMMTS